MFVKEKFAGGSNVGFMESPFFIDLVFYYVHHSKNMRNGLFHQKVFIKNDIEDTTHINPSASFQLFLMLTMLLNI